MEANLAKKPSSIQVVCPNCKKITLINLPHYQYAKQNNQILIYDSNYACSTYNCGKLVIRHDSKLTIHRITHLKNNFISPIANTNRITPYSIASYSNEHKISLKTNQILEKANQIILKTKSLVPYGAANQKTHYHDSLYNCHTTSRAAWSYTPQNTYDYSKKKLIDNNPSRPLRIAAYAHKAQSGTCDSINALAYCLAKDEFDSNVNISLVTSLTPISHCLVIISSLDNSFEKIAIDAWPISSRAVLWKHHFSYPSINHIKKQTKGISDNHYKQKRLDLLLQRSKDIPSPNFQKNIKCSAMFDYRYPTSKDYHNIIYKI